MARGFTLEPATQSLPHALYQPRTYVVRSILLVLEIVPASGMRHQEAGSHACGSSVACSLPVHLQAQSFVLDNICFSTLPASQWPVFTPSPPAVPSSCPDLLLTFDDVALGELCAVEPWFPSSCLQT